ncbi:hypothetical protein FACS189434_13280 [Bacteroidia bacterium]|nr:hypothetical protein FACS189434_13280 [Bacteroidia bacterium]
MWINLEVQDMFEDDRFVFFKTPFYRPNDYFVSLGRRNANFEAEFWRVIADITGRIASQMFDRRKVELIDGFKFKQAVTLEQYCQMQGELVMYCDKCRKWCDITDVKLYLAFANDILAGLQKYISKHTADEQYKEKTGALAAFLTDNNMAYIASIFYDNYRQTLL